MKTNRFTATSTTRLAALVVVILSNTACSDSEAEVDNCKLLTANEVSALAGFDVVVGQDTPLGCPFTRPGDLTGQVFIGSGALNEPDVRARAELGYPEASDILPVEGVENDTVAVLTPTGGTVAAIVTGVDGRFVELSVFMLGIEPGDRERIHSAAVVATLALDRATN